MRKLNINEIKEVNGGVIPVPVPVAIAVVRAILTGLSKP